MEIKRVCDVLRKELYNTLDMVFIVMVKTIT